MKTAILTNQRPRFQPRSRQGGAALLIAMLIVVLGLVTLLTFRTDRKGPEMEAQRKTALALAQAKEALLGRAASNNDPGTLSCPSTNGTIGEAKTTNFGKACGDTVTGFSSNLGWFAWKSLGSGELRDGSASLLWYMESEGYVDKGIAPPPYADTLQVNVIEVDVNPADLSETVISNTAVPNVAAVILAPGRPLSSQNRSGVAMTDSSNWAAYLEVTADTVANTLTIKVERKRDGAVPIKYNDQFLFITTKEIIERSAPYIAKEIAAQISTYRIDMTVYPPTGWLPKDLLPKLSDWNDSDGTYTQWTKPDPSTGAIPAQYQNLDLYKGVVRFTGCDAVFSIELTSGIDKVTRAGHC